MAPPKGRKREVKGEARVTLSFLLALLKEEPKLCSYLLLEGKTSLAEASARLLGTW